MSKIWHRVHWQTKQAVAHPTCTNTLCIYTLPSPSPSSSHCCSPAGLGIFTRPNTPIARPKKSQALKLPSPKQGLRPVCTELLPQQHIIIHRPINPSTHSTHVTTNYTYTLMSVRCLAGYRPTEVSVYPGNSQIQPDQHQPRWQAVGSVLLCQKYTRLPRVSRKEKKKIPASGASRGVGERRRGPDADQATRDRPDLLRMMTEMTPSSQLSADYTIARDAGDNSSRR